jgi:hypothetical protein
MTSLIIIGFTPIHAFQDLFSRKVFVLFLRKKGFISIFCDINFFSSSSFFLLHFVRFNLKKFRKKENIIIITVKIKIFWLFISVYCKFEPLIKNFESLISKEIYELRYLRNALLPFNINVKIILVCYF